jgi:hypothetical protein
MSQIEGYYSDIAEPEDDLIIREIPIGIDKQEPEVPNRRYS